MISLGAKQPRIIKLTIISVRERMGASARLAAQEAERRHPAWGAGIPIYRGTANSAPTERPVHRAWPAFLSSVRSTLLTIVGTLIAAGVVWGVMALWNALHVAGVQISGDVQQVVLEIIVTIGILRLFDFNPRRDPDFAWVLLTRLVVMLGIYTVLDFLQFYMRDAVGAPHPEQQTANFLIIVSLTSVVSSLVAGWLSDRFGRKRMVYIEWDDPGLLRTQANPSL